MDTIIQMLDMADKNVEIEISKDGKKLWVNVNEICRLRVNNSFFKHANPESEPSITINDKRAELPNSNIEIELTATGRVGSGKGTILTFIAEALEQKGCSVTTTGENSIRINKSKNDNS